MVVKVVKVVNLSHPRNLLRNVTCLALEYRILGTVGAPLWGQFLSSVFTGEIGTYWDRWWPLRPSWIPVGCLGEAAAAREAVITSPELFENVFSPEEPSLLWQRAAGRPKQEDLLVMVS